MCTLHAGVCFYCPSYVAGLNIPGYHFHFLTEDKKAGGHLFECVMEKALVEIDHISTFCLALPETDDFFKVEALQ
jgi:acetolactate decarboxylase